MQEDLSKDDEIEDETLGDEEKGDAYKDNTYVADATLNEGENQDAEVSKAGETIPTDGAGATPNEGNGHANEEQAVAVSTADETSFVDVPVQNDENGPAPEVFEQPAPSDNDAYLPTIVDEGTIVGETETEAKTLDSSAMPQTNSAADATDVDETKASASEANIPPKLLTPATSADNSAPLAQPESSNVLPSAENVPNQTPAQKGLHPQLVERLVRVARTANMIKNILSVLTKH
uniref:Uncharacterized protein n=1 Tax=Anopheles maculatus TaxID=74869 RepID=A0A182SRG5_9DIPT